MYIKSIKVSGFKSFADKLDFDLNSGINAIVGPNGSGKSNIVDAILWVLGEQSVKQLRGDETMSNIIFSGSGSRDGMKKASVAILFDNTDHTLNSELNEVEIKRIIYKTGENEYYINNARVRLKDIQNILLDVTSKFNIITQGNISALVENKSSERRVLFESAAGVLKYKKRKEEALKKLDGTKENLTRVNLIIKELNTSLEPLEKQKEDAKRYLDIKKDLENIEISLLASDISILTEKLDKLKLENESLHKQIDALNLTHPISLEKMKLESIKLDEEITNINGKLLEITKKISGYESEKQIILERAKFSIDKNKVNEDLISLNESKLEFERNIHSLNEELTLIKEELQKLVNEYKIQSDNALKVKIKLTSKNNELNNLNKDILILQNKISIEKANQENNAFLPKSVSNILANPRLKGIHNTIKNVLEINEAHDIAITTALGASANFLIVDNMNSAKSAIEYLKESHLGKATFFPIDTIKSRKITSDVVYSIEKEQGFIGIASDLVSFDNIYKQIIENQLGNTIVMDGMDEMFKLAKKLDYRYKMVTLEGEILFPGGSIAGGSSSEMKSSKNILNNLIKELNQKKANETSLNIEIKTENENFDKVTKICEELGQKISEKKLFIQNKENNLLEVNNKSSEVIKKINSLSQMENSDIDKQINDIMNLLNELLKEKETLEINLKDQQNKKFELTSEISELEKKLSDQSASYRHLENIINTNQVEIGKIEVKIDNSLTNLSNDYNMTYEFAINNYTLDIDSELARSRVNKLKNELNKLHDINIGSIAEYDRLKKRYDFLDKQKVDLEESSKELYDVISDMDSIMIDKFKKTFDKIAEEFTKVFRVMFKGGNGLLKLADENDLLNTGINIVAVPPGKKLNSTTFLSGGEKSLTAICLIFAILNVKPAPFIVLDEAEAALDEENVNMFGEYLSNMKNKSQFILITHKKKMMEYADVLYGITMQESGVSKLVSVRLEDK